MKQRSLKDAITVSDKETAFEFNYIKLPFTKERPKVVLGVSFSKADRIFNMIQWLRFKLIANE